METSKITYLRQDDVKKVALSIAEIIESAEKSFAKIGNGQVKIPPKSGIHPDESGNNSIQAMTAYTRALNAAGGKWVRGYPGNPAKPATKGEVVPLTSVNEIPEAQCADKQTCIDWGIRANFVMPILASEAVVHVIAINDIHRERVWPEETISRLQLLGEIFISTLERRKAEKALRDSKERLRQATSLAEVGFWEMNVETGRIWATDKLREVLQFNPEESLSFERFLERIHTDDRESAKNTLARCLQTRDLVSLEYRIVPPDGGLHWVASRARSYPAMPDRPERLMGVTIDITRRKAMEAKLIEQKDEIRQLKQKVEKENIYLREKIELQYTHEEVVGRSQAMKRILAQVEQVARTDATVLIEGETGTGKELLARAVHRLSERRNRRMLTINCAALPHTLIESELFGREKGAYTGALTQMKGRFEAADGSTLFLDEIGELTPQMQAKLLRVLEQGRFERLGSSRTLQVNVRIIAASNRNLFRDVQEGKFRKDLYYRLNVFPIAVPPLRERPEDIPLLVWTFVRQYEQKMGKRIEKIPRECLENLQHQPWPGNARELRNVVERAMIVSEAQTLCFSMPRETSSNSPISTRLEDAERRHILAVLEKSGWLLSGSDGAAAKLGLKRTTLHSKMKKLGIKRPAK
jgi:formate hydrogenlyase transcriptional activator